ncbi:allophanate hydrolase [Georgenia daeguensis]|uniref:Allophanate hydrolase n=1 Tax=Georgenia daeguensis TaxID=908355 RepID=A0ABP8ESM8_9MICO
MTAPTAAVAAAFDRIDAAHRQDIWIRLQDRAAALDEAVDVEARLAAGADLPLAGLTFAVKDNIDVAGLPTTAAHPAFRRVPASTATAVERLRAAGAVLVGKTNLDQFATGLVGTRSPYGRVASALDPDRVSGGSSSGSGVAVGLGLVDFALGTDTAGSGRVPAAFNGVVGLKPTHGLVPADGVVPACPSYDCVSVFAPDVALAARVLDVLAGPAAAYPHSRPRPADAPLAAPARPVVAVPRETDLAPLSPAMRGLFADAVARLEATGAAVREIDLTPFLEAARLLYDGGLVAERAASFGEFLAAHPDGADPAVAAVADRAARVRGTQVVRDQQLLARLTARGLALLDGAHALLLPTAPEHPRTADVLGDRAGAINSRLGTYTNFVNLMDLAAVAVPAGRVPGEGAFGVTVVTRAFADQVGLDLAARLLGEPTPPVPSGGVDVAVFGAHLRGEPLNGDLEALGARFAGEIATAPGHRMYLVPGDVPRPVVAEATFGIEIPGELWRLPAAAVATLLTSLPAPMALGPVRLADGRTVTGFTGRLDGTETDITAPGGWRAYRATAFAVAG